MRPGTDPVKIGANSGDDIWSTLGREAGSGRDIMNLTRAFPALVLVLLLLVITGRPSRARKGSVVTYWGQNGNEGSLSGACASERYSTIILAFLNEFGEGRTPRLNLAGHCNPEAGTCAGLSEDIRSCQARGVKLFLSLGGGIGKYGLASAADAKNLSEYLWNNFLGGRSASRPLGPAALDGIDLDIESGGHHFYDHLARHLTLLAGNWSKRLYLSAAPQCPYPDAHVGPGAGSVLASGLLDYAWVQFYNNPPCSFNSSAAGSEDVSGVLRAWMTWTSGVKVRRVFLGLPASPGSANIGYIPPRVLISRVLPRVRRRRRYGGVMLWSYFTDVINRYSIDILPSV